MNKIENMTLTDLELIEKCKKLEEEHKKLIGNYLRKDIKRDEIVNKKYAVGGELLHRGYYCPSPIYDIVISNVHRGKLVKDLNDKVIYIYSFDKFGRLVEMENIEEFVSKEFIWYENDNQYSVSMLSANPNDHISNTTRCIYEDNRIMRYEFVTVSSKGSNGEKPDDYKIYDIEVEEYFYNENGELASVLRYIYFKHKGGFYIARRCLYELIRDSDNKVTHYREFHIRNGEICSNNICLVQKNKQRII